jgi:hypothetical protein
MWPTANCTQTFAELPLKTCNLQSGAALHVLKTSPDAPASLTPSEVRFMDELGDEFEVLPGFKELRDDAVSWELEEVAAYCQLAQS